MIQELNIYELVVSNLFYVLHFAPFFWALAAACSFLVQLILPPPH